MSDTYYSYRDVKVKIAHRLFKMDGWKVYGYHADNSDSMTDYWDPAYWGGIATKNGFTLVIDHSTAAQEYRRTYKVYSEEDPEIREKIAKLEKMTQTNGASEQEEQTARAAIEKLKEKQTAGTIEKEDFTPGHLANPPRCNWHIEKDGIILDKGTGLLKFADVPDITRDREQEEWQKYNTKTREEWIEEYAREQVYRWHDDESTARRRAESEYERTADLYILLDKFNELIARFNNVCGGMVGNAGESGFTYEMRKETKYKKVYKFQKNESGAFVEGQCFRLNANFNYGCFKGLVYKFMRFTDETIRGQKVSLKSGKVLTGTADSSNSFGYYAKDGIESNRGRDKEKFLKWINDGSIEWGEVIEVMEPYVVEKYVKVDRNGNEYKKKAAPKDETTTTTTANYTIKADTDTRDGSPLFVVTLSDRVSREKFDEIRAQFKSLGGYYSKFKKGFIFREDPTEAIKATETPAADEATEETPAKAATCAGKYNTPEEIRAAFIEDGWKDPTFREATPEEVLQFTPAPALKLFVMIESGNIYDANGKIYKYNIKPASDTAETPAEEKPEEIPTDAPKAESAPVYGYIGETCEQFTPEELHMLYNGAQIKQGENYRRRAYFSAEYKNGVKFVYSVHICEDTDTIIPKSDPTFCGFIYNGVYYTDFAKISESLSDSINTELLQQLPTEAAAEKNAVDLDKYQEESAERLRIADYTKEAARHHVDDTTPELYLFSNNGRIQTADIINYIINPAEIVKSIADAFKQTHRAEILNKYIQYNGIVKALNAIRADKANQAHTLKRIKRATAGGSEKTYKIKLANGHTIKADADAVRRMAYCGYISEWYINNADRQYLRHDDRGKAQDVTPEEVREISHGSKTLYRATA